MAALGDWLTVAEAAELAGFHPNHIRRLIRGGDIGAQRWAREWMVSKQSLEQYLERMQIKGEKRGPKPEN